MRIHADRADVAHDHRVAVRRRFHRKFGGDVAVAAGAVVDEHLLAETFAEFLREHATDRVGAATGGVRDDEADRLLRIGLCGHARTEQKTDGQTCKSECSFPKFHSLPPLTE